MVIQKMDLTRDEKDLKVPFFKKRKTYTIFFAVLREREGFTTSTVRNSSLSSGFYNFKRAWLSQLAGIVFMCQTVPLSFPLTERLVNGKKSVFRILTSTWFFYIVKPATMENELLLPTSMGLCTFFLFCGLGKKN